ncbi:hypothetical protein CC80DRAFT_384702, partial [Byssothecium circinans]
MSYMLQFPPIDPLPPSSHKPPYVKFGINGIEISHDLPREIPLALVLHYIPKVQQWLLPAPTHLPLRAQKAALTKPYIGINILADIRAEALSEVLVRMLQHAGHTHKLTRQNFYIHPTIRFSIAIHNAWLALGLPSTGLANLHTHMQSQLIHGPPIQETEIKVLWSLFPATSPVLHEMGMNFIRSHLDKAYTQPQFSEIRRWYLRDKDKYVFFRALESQFPRFESVQKELIDEVIAKRKADEEQKKILEEKKRAVSEKKAVKRRMKERRD